MKITKNTSYLLKFPLNKKRRGQHISTLPFPVFIAITEAFFLISKTVEKPNSYNQHSWLNHHFWFHRNTFLGLFSLSTIVVFLQVVKNHTISHYHYFIFNITMFLSFSDEVKLFYGPLLSYITANTNDMRTQTLRTFSSAPKPREL